MKLIIYCLFISIFLFDYLVFELGVLPRQLTWSPEILSGMCLLASLVILAVKKVILLDKKYIFLFLAFMLNVACGIVLNFVDPGVLFAGFRKYFRYLPFFLLPAIYKFSDKDIKKQLYVLLFFGIIQFPVAIIQRFFQYRNWGTGDIVRGTIDSSSILSLYLISSMAILMAFFIRKRLDIKVLSILMLILFIPATLSETKGAVLLLPFAFLVPSFFDKKNNQESLRKLYPLFFASTLLFLFIGVYDLFYGGKHGLVDFFSDKEHIISYLYKSEGYTEGKARRFDTIVQPFHESSDKPLRLLVGVGIGNASESFISVSTGKYFPIVKQISSTGHKTSLGEIIWELGILGVILYLLFIYYLYYDAKDLCKIDSISGILALGWIAISIMMIICLPYKSLIHSNVIGFLFWYLSGYIAAERYRALFIKKDF